MQTNTPRRINAGMWVATAEGRIGILTDFGAPASTEAEGEQGGVTLFTAAGVDLVNDDGSTLLSVRVPFDTLRQATLAQIPAARRPTPEHGARLGYTSEPSAAPARRGFFGLFGGPRSGK